MAHSGEILARQEGRYPMVERPATLGGLIESGYQTETVKDEMRRNLIARIESGQPLFPGIIGYEESVLPQIQNAILAKHDILLLGLRGQAKTRMLRMLVTLLDDAIPIVEGSEINDDPLSPSSNYARTLVAEKGNDCPIEWIGTDQRYREKLATPDVTIADLIGEIDMIKHAEGRYLSSELTMHFGLIPRTNRGVFCMNELPDLAPKIQVGLFNVLEERDIQIRGYPVRLQLDTCMVFSANPEDYTNRGRIVTPLKDRIGSVVQTHYPLNRAIGITITDDNAWSERCEQHRVIVPSFMKEIVEETSQLARSSSHVNQASGVSVRMSIANLENMISNAERRAISLKENPAVARISDLQAVMASSRGKLELTMSEDDGQEDKVIRRLLAEAVKNVFEERFKLSSFREVVQAFEEGNTIEVGDQVVSENYVKRISESKTLRQAIDLAAENLIPEASRSDPAHLASCVEFVLEGLHVHNKLNKNLRDGKNRYSR